MSVGKIKAANQYFRGIEAGRDAEPGVDPYDRKLRFEANTLLEHVLVKFDTPDPYVVLTWDEIDQLGIGLQAMAKSLRAARDEWLESKREPAPEPKPENGTIVEMKPKRKQARNGQ